MLTLLTQLFELLNKLADGLKQMFVKTVETKEKTAAAKVDAEADANAKAGRPSGDFWKE